MKFYSREESNAVLKDLQERLDKKGRLLRFEDMFIKTKPPSISYVIGTALNMHSTESYINGKTHHQYLGHSRSMQDLYLLVKYYFPKATIFDVKDELQRRVDSGGVRYFLCYSFNRIMFRNGRGYSSNEAIASKYGIS